MDSWDIRSLDVEAHKPQVLMSVDAARAIVIDLPAGEEMQEHRTHEAGFLVVVDGEVEIQHEGHSVSGSSGFFAYFPVLENRRVLAQSHARLLLILGPWPGEGHPSKRA